MTEEEVQAWKLVARDLNIEIESPFLFQFPDGERIYASALVRHFGASRGIVLDADFSVLQPHIDRLLENGFGFSAVGGSGKYDRAVMIEVLTDWSWSGPSDEKPGWLP